MVQWRVSEPYINLWLHDTPLWYQPALGEPVEFRLNFKQRDEVVNPEHSIFGFGWNSTWLSYVESSDAQYHMPPTTAKVVRRGIFFESALFGIAETLLPSY